MNRTFSKYWSTVREIGKSNEVVNGAILRGALFDSIVEFKNTSKHDPVNVIIFKDGVSSGQRPPVYEQEFKSY